MEWLLYWLVSAPALLALASLGARTPRGALRTCAVGTTVAALLAVVVACRVFIAGPLTAAADWLRLDALSAFHLLVMAAVFMLSSLFAVGYFEAEIAAGVFAIKLARRYVALWFGSLAAMTLVLVSNNLGILWVGIEATTLLTAFLICIHASPSAIEAMWKYLLICSVGVALAFTGTLLVAASAGSADLHGTDAMLWTRLREAAPRLDPPLLKAGFIFLFVGYGTKAGLAPMHTWLPDAHSQAPSPVSALFSGFLLNVALYCILRYLPLTEIVAGSRWGRDILVAAGLLSIFVAAAFMLPQVDIKRLLAYSSVEHLGIVALGVGLGPAGAVAALLHLFNHSIGKSLCFACAGRLGQAYGTHDLRCLVGAGRASPLWGGGLLAGLLLLIGVAPGAVFLSEFLILKAAITGRAAWTAVLFLVGIGVIFVAVLRRVMPLAWGATAAPADSAENHAAAAVPLPLAPDDGGVRGRWCRLGEAAVVLVPLAALVVLGLCVPGPFITIVRRAAAVLGGAL